MIRGRPLESAIARAFKWYATAGRGEAEKKQLKRLWGGKIVGGAPLDFTGIAWGYGERGENIGFAIEAKEVERDLPFGEGGLRQSQFDALNEFLKKKGDRKAWLVVDVKAEGEVYRLDWAVVQREFMRLDGDRWLVWRKSIDLKFLRAFGERCKVSGDGDARRVWALDTFRPEGVEAAALAVIAERAGKAMVTLFDDVEAVQCPVVRLTKEQRLDGVRAAIKAYKPKKKGAWR